MTECVDCPACREQNGGWLCTREPGCIVREAQEEYAKRRTRRRAETAIACELHGQWCVQHAHGRLWRHERRGSFLLARTLCWIFGHDWNVWLDEDNEPTRGDCRRCWA